MLKLTSLLPRPFAVVASLLHVLTMPHAPLSSLATCLLETTIHALGLRQVIVPLMMEMTVWNPRDLKVPLPRQDLRRKNYCHYCHRLHFLRPTH